MKNRFHVFCHKFTELAEVNMLVFFLLALLMVPSAWADNVDITYNGQTVTPPCSDDRTLTVASGVTSFVITHPNIPAGYAHSCSGMLYVNAPSGNSLSLSGEAKLRSGNSLYIYDGSGTSVSLYAKTGSGSYSVPTLYTSNTQATILFSHDGHIDNTNYVALNVTVLPSHFVSVSVPWKQESPWNYYVIWDRTGSWWYPEYRLDKVEFYVGQTVPTGKAPYLTMTLWGLNVKDANGNLLTTTQVNDSLLFTMPASDVTVVPTFSNCSDSYRGCGYNLVNESRTVNIGANSSINVYDDGGIDYPYANNFNGYLTVKAPAGHRVKVSGTVATEANGFDYLELYEGVKGASSSPICKVYSADSNVAVAVPANCKSVDSVLTLRFKTDHSAFANGLNLVVSAEPKIYNVTLNNNQLSKGTVSSDKVEAETRSTVTLTAYPESGYILKSVSVVNTATNATVATSGGWETDNKITFTMPAGNVEVTPNFVTNTYNINKIKIDGGDIELESTSAIVGSVVTLTAKSDDGYMLKDVVVKDASGNSVKINKNEFTSVKFTMPIGDVTVIPSWTKDLTVEGGLYLNMPKTGAPLFTIPKGVKSFKVYDDGGKDGNYSNNAEGKLLLIAPDGNVLVLTGNVNTYNSSDKLLVYNNLATDANLLGTLSGSSYCAYSSEARRMTLKFVSDGSGNASGLDLTVKVVKYELVQGDDGGKHYVNMFYQHKMEYNIPETLKSFKVYDEGGKDGDYIGNNRDTLVLKAPAGYVLQLSGSVMTQYSYDSLRIYSGVDVNADSLLGSYKSYANATGEARTVNKVLSMGNSMTLLFHSNGYDSYAGLDLTVKVVEVEAVLENDGESDYVNMFYQHKVTFEIPDTLKSFKVYDEGGKSENYNGNNRDTLVLKAPAGYLLQLSGSVMTQYSYDSLRIYSGVDVNADSLLGSYKSYANATGEARTVNKVLSMGNSMTLLFHSNGYDSYAGLDLTVKVVEVEAVLENDGESDYVNMFYQHKVTFEIPDTLKSFKVYDEGGKSENYNDNNSDTLVLKAPAGYLLQLSGSVATDAYGNDSLRVYNGAGVNADSLLGTYKRSSDISKVLSLSNSMTLVFNSNGYTNDAGLDLTVKVVKVEAVLENDGEFDYVNMFYQHKVTFEIPDTLKSFKVYDEGGKDENYNDNNSDTLVLKAPAGYLLQLSGSVATDAYGNDSLRVYNGAGVNADSLLGTYKRSSDISKVLSLSNSMTLVFNSNGYTNDAGLDLIVKVVKVEVVLENDGESDYVNMFYQRKVTFEIPDTLKSFKVYDEGGKDGNYSGNNRDSLVLKAPAGYVLQLSGSVTTEGSRYDSLRVYNGAGVNADSLLGTYKSSISGKVLSRGESMTLLFHSDGSYNAAGLDLTVKVIPIVNQITYTNKNSGGSVTTDSPRTGKIDSIVNYSYSYSSGYIVKEIKAVSADGDGVTVNGGWYNDKKAFFKMPPAAVTLTSTYTNNLSAEGGLYINMLRYRKVTATIPEGVKSFKVYDNGGKDGDYSNYSSDTLVLMAPAGYVLQLSGSVTTQYVSDYLGVYNGAEVNTDKLLETYWGLITISNVLSMGNSMTFVFNSDGSNNFAGLDLTVTLVPKEYTLAVTNVAGGSLADVPETASTGDLVTLTAVPTNSNYMLVKFVVKDAAGNEVPVIRNTLTEGKFKMPASNVTITPVFADTRSTDITAADGFHLDMTRNNTVEINLPTAVKSFKLYDHGGKTGDYIENSNDTLVFTAPAGYHFKVTGSIYTEINHDKLYVYNGSSTTEKVLFNHSSVEHGVRYDVGSIETSSNSKTVRFHSDGSRNYAGLDLTVTVVLSSYTVAIEQTSGGTLSSDKESAIMGEKVTLTATPDEGYMLNGFVIKDASGNDVPFRGGDFIDKQGSFTMPASNVTVTPVFTQDYTDIFVTVPATGTKTFEIPEGVESFKVYDDGGPDLAYSLAADGSLVLIAPEGSKIKFAGTGEAHAYRKGMIPSAYDGTSSDATQLTWTKTIFQNGFISTSNAFMVNIKTLDVPFTQDDYDYQRFLGINATVTVISPSVQIVDVDGGSVTADDVYPSEGDVVTLTATPDEGYMLNGFVIKDASGNDVPFRGGDFIDKQGSFTMPAGNVTVTPVFTNKPIDLFVTIPATGTKTVNLLDGMNAFYVYDDGGSTGLLGHSYNANGSLVLIAPENATMNATVMWMGGENSAAWVETFDGTSSDAPSFGKADPGYRHRYTSTGNAMTFSMTTSANVTGPVNIIINVIAKRNINVVSVDGGTAASDKTTADRNETVTVTATPDDGLLFKGVKVTDKFGSVLGVRGYQTGVNEIWTNNNVANFPKEVSFRMPNSDINVEPMFGEELEASDSLFLKMPETGSETVTIPSRVASFNVYDDGGRGGTFSSNADGNLVLTAPEGFRFQVSGSVSAWAKDIAHLCVYEGGTVSDDKALVCGTGSVFAAAATDQDYDSYVGEIGTTVSEGNTITLRFWTTSSWETGDGIELVVTVLKPHYGAVTIVRNDDGTSKAVLDGDYNGSEVIKIASPIAVDEIDFQRAFSARTPSTAILPFTLPEGSTTNAEFYQLTEVKQVNRSWKARFDYIGDGVLPQANTPYALILPAGQTKLEFNLNNKQAMVQTSNIDTVKVSNDDWLFVGVYSYKVWEPGDEELGLAYAFSGKDNSNEGKFGKIKIADNATKLSDYPYANPLRAYLRKKDAGVVLKARGRAVASLVASFGLENLPETIDAEFVRETANGEKTTFVGRMNTRTGEFKMLRDYDLKGRRVNGTNKARGAYYGKKVIKK